MGIRSLVWRMLSVGAAVALLISACASGPAGPSGSSGNKPTVVIQAPVSGAAVAVGQALAVSGTASDAVGVDHVALFVDGVSVASTPSSAPAPTVPFSLNWLATPAGPHELKVIAYRADGTTSDPATVSVVVGAGASGVSVGPGASGVALPSVTVPTVPPAPKPTKKPKPPKSQPPATSQPSTTATEPPTTPPTTAPTLPPTPTAIPLPTAAADGTAPFDTEPYVVVLDPANPSGCPPDAAGIPMAAIGCIWEQLSAPAGDSTDEIDFALAANTSYKMQMTTCSDVSDQTVWLTANQDPSLKPGCGDWLLTTTAATPEAVQKIVITFATAPTQVYNLYQFTIYQCQFINCGTQ